MNLVGMKEVAELLDVPYETIKVWKARGRLPDPMQIVSGTPLWDWDISEEDFNKIPIHENQGRPKKPYINIGEGLIEIDVNKDSEEKRVKIKLMGNAIVDILAKVQGPHEPKKVKIKLFGKNFINLNTEDFENFDNKDIDLEVEIENEESENNGKDENI